MSADLMGIIELYTSLFICCKNKMCTTSVSIRYMKPELEVPKTTEWQEQISHKSVPDTFWSLLFEIKPSFRLVIGLEANIWCLNHNINALKCILQITHWLHIWHCQKYCSVYPVLIKISTIHYRINIPIPIPTF